jgi:hypothetical protein
MLGNICHPGNERGAGSEESGFVVLLDMGFDVLQNSLSEVSRKLNLPFRGAHEADRPPERETNN